MRCDNGRSFETSECALGEIGPWDPRPAAIREPVRDTGGVQRAVSILLLSILVAVLGLGIVTWRADEAARSDREEQLCLERAQASAAVAGLIPRAVIDEQGRIDAARALSDQVDAC